MQTDNSEMLEKNAVVDIPIQKTEDTTTILQQVDIFKNIEQTA